MFCGRGAFFFGKRKEMGRQESKLKECGGDGANDYGKADGMGTGEW